MFRWKFLSISFCLLFCWLAPPRQNPHKHFKDMGTIKGVVQENLTALPSSTDICAHSYLILGHRESPLSSSLLNSSCTQLPEPKEQKLGHTALLLPRRCANTGTSLLTHHRQHLTPRGSRAPQVTQVHKCLHRQKVS